MKRSEYKLAGDIPSVLLGKDEQRDGKTVKVPYTVTTREAETLEELRQLVEGGKDEHIVRAAQAHIDIVVQRKVREFLASDEVQDALAGKTVKWSESDEVDYSDTSTEERIDDVLARAQEVSDNYVHGTRAVSFGAGKQAKQAVEDKKKIAEAAKNDPELAEKLAALGITL